MSQLESSTSGPASRSSTCFTSRPIDQDTAVLIVTHNREIARVAHRVIELSSGRIVSDVPNPGGPAEISELHW